MMTIRRILALVLAYPWLAFAGNPQTGCNELIANQAQPHITINAADRCTTALLAGQLTLNFASDANLTLSTTQWQYATIKLTDTGPILSTARDVIYPNVDTYTGGTSRATFLFVNATAQTLTIKRSGQTGVAVTAGSSALLHHNGTDVEAISTGGGGGLTSPVGLADGGTGLTSAADDVTIVSNGSAWQAKTLPDCTDTGGNHLNYTQSTNGFTCGTSGGGGSAGGSTTQVQYNNSGALAGESAFTWDATANTLNIGDTANGIIEPTASAGNGYNLEIHGGQGAGGGGGNGGALTLRAGYAIASGVGGGLYIQQASGTSAPGAVSLRNAAASELMGISQSGLLTFGAAGNTGSDGDVLVQQSVNGPVWTTPGAATSGGTGQTTVTQGDLLYGSASNTWSKLAKSATATRYLANTGTSNNPAWAQVNVANGVTGTLTQANRLRTVRTITAAGAVTGAATDEIICVNKTVGAATTVNLHSSPATGFEYTIKDCKGDAATNNITITPAAGNVDGAGTLVINANYGKATVFYSGSGWFSE